MAIVKCKYCNKQFDREKVPYVQIPYGSKSFRYGHSTCYIDAVNNKVEKNQYEIWDPSTSTNCFWCHKAIFPNQPGVIEMPQLKGRYVHETCSKEHPCNDEEEMNIFLIDLFKLKDDYILPRYMKQLTQYMQNYNFTMSGMLKALKYWYKVKGNPVDLNRGVGIIPYVYKHAYDYYYALYMANEKNYKIEDFKKYIPEDINIQIKPPERKIEKHEMFTFLDKDDVSE